MAQNSFIEKQKIVLEAILERLSGQRGKDADRHTDSVSDTIDASSLVTEIDNAMALVSNARQTAQEVSDALRRIADGVYGICEISGEQIPIERLEAIPWARFTVKVQSEYEKNSSRRGPGRPGALFDETVAEGDGDEEGEEETEREKERKK